MSATLKEQMEKTLSVAREMIGNVNISTSDSELIVSTAQESVLEAYGDMLEERERELVQQLHVAVMEYSAKIAATRSLLRTIGRESARREVWREGIEGGEALEEATTDTAGRRDQKPPGRTEQDAV